MISSEIPPNSASEDIDTVLTQDSFNEYKSLIEKVFNEVLLKEELKDYWNSINEYLKNPTFENMRILIGQPTEEDLPKIYIKRKNQLEFNLRIVKKMKDIDEITKIEIALNDLKRAEKERLRIEKEQLKIKEEQLKIDKKIEKEQLKIENELKKEQLKIDKKREQERLKDQEKLAKNKEILNFDISKLKTKNEIDIEEIEKKYDTEDYNNDTKIITYNIIGLEQAKESLENNFWLRSQTSQPQKLILLEGAVGTGKTTLIQNMCREFCDKYPDRFRYQLIGVPDVTAHVTTTSIKIINLWTGLQKHVEDGKHIILFIDESDEIYSSRAEKCGDIKMERTFTMIRMLNLNVPNTLIILASNRPKMIDPSVLDRCGERIMCPLPTYDELRKIIKLHMPFLSMEKRKLILNFIMRSSCQFNGRDIFNLAAKYKELIDLKALKKIDQLLEDIEITKYLLYLESSKRNLRNDYLKPDDTV